VTYAREPEHCQYHAEVLSVHGCPKVSGGGGSSRRRRRSDSSHDTMRRSSLSMDALR